MRALNQHSQTKIQNFSVETVRNLLNLDNKGIAKLCARVSLMPKKDLYGRTYFTKDDVEILRRVKGLAEQQKTIKRSNEPAKASKSYASVPMKKAVHQLQPQQQAVQPSVQAPAAVAADRICASLSSMENNLLNKISKLVDAEHLDIDPGITAFQRLFARLGRPWENAALFSVHGSDSPLPWRRILNAGTSVIYGDSRRTASDLAAALITLFPECATRSAAIGCELGSTREKIFSGTLAELAEKSAPALSLLVVFPEEGKRPGLPLGLPDSDYQHAANMITHPEVRAVVLSKLRAVSGVMWDLGAGSGSVGLEAAGLAPELTVYAVEKNPGRAADLRVNAQRHGIPLHVEEGEIASVAGSLPDPDRVFFGGGSMELETVFARLRPGGILVATAVLVETAVRLESVLTEFRTELLTLNVSRACKMSGGEFWRAENPITIAVFQK